MTTFVLGRQDRLTVQRALGIASASNRFRARQLKIFGDEPGLGTYHRQLAERLTTEAGRFDALAARIDAQDRGPWGG